MKITLKIEFGGKVIELSEQEADELYSKLREMRGDNNPLFAPFIPTLPTTTPPHFEFPPGIWC